MHLGGVSHESFLTLDVEDGGGRSGPPLLDPPQPPEHLHGLGGANGSTGEVEGDVGERGHVLRLLDEVRDTCRVQDQGEEHAGKSEHRQETVQVRSESQHTMPSGSSPSTVIQARSEENTKPWNSTSHQY